MQDFQRIVTAALDGAYDLVIDARSEREYNEDHLPGALNLPVVDNDEFAQVGTLHRADPHRAYLIGVSYSLRNIARAVDDLVGRFPKNSRMLVYCFRGGKRSKLWFDALSTIGFRTERLPGGWKAYRAWVREQLGTAPTRLTYNVLCGPTGCGKTRILDALSAVGAQVLDLEDLARHRGSLIGAIPGVSQPPQKWFDSMLLEKLRSYDPSRPVWVEAESKKIGAIELPIALFEAMHRGRVYRVDAPMPERVKLWREDYSHFERDPDALVERLRHLLPLVGREEFSLWERLASECRMPELFERLMEAHYDPAYSRSIQKHYPGIDVSPIIAPASLDPDTLRGVAEKLQAQ